MHDNRRWSRLRLVAVIAVGALAVLTVPASAQVPAPGAFLGAVLISDDADAASVFYRGLFGWETERAPDGGYAVRHHGRMVAGISPLQNAKEDIEGSFWLVGLVVPDIGAALTKAAANGGKVFENAERVRDFGHFAVIADRQRAPLMLIEPGREPLGGTPGPGSWVWPELWTDDVDDAAAFYAEVIGFASEIHHRGGEPYHVLSYGGTPRAGIIEIPAELERVEPGWAPYVAVADLDASLAEVTRLGGTVVFRTAEHPAQAVVALIRDPTGAVLFLYQIGSLQETSR
jgi:predicted enzyme related to lactoylglutathione lyase